MQGELLWEIMQWQHCTQGHLSDWTTVYMLYLNASHLLFLCLSLKDLCIHVGKQHSKQMGTFMGTVCEHFEFLSAVCCAL